MIETAGSLNSLRVRTAAAVAMCGWVLQATAVVEKLFLTVHPAGG